MKRLMLCSACAALIASIFAVFGLYVISTVSAVVFGVIAVMFLFIKKRGFISFTVTSIIICAVFASSAFFGFSQSKIEYSEQSEVKATVTNVSYGENSAVYALSVFEINGERVKTKLTVPSILGANLVSGDRVKMTVYFDNENDSLYAQKIELLRHDKGFYKARNSLRAYIRKIFTENMNYDEASLLIAISSGEKSAIALENLKLIRSAGISHIVVVSGMHLSILMGALMWMMNLFKVPQKRKGIIGIGSLFLFVAVSGFSLSTIRAAVTFLIIFIGFLINRKADNINSLAASVTFIIMFNPTAITDISFLLSVSATCAVLVFTPTAYRKITANLTENNKILSKGIYAILIVISALLFTMPFSAWYFGTVSNVSIVTNLLTTFVVPIILILSVITVLLSAIPFLSAIFKLIAGIFAKYIVFIYKTMGSLSYAEITLKSPKLVSLAFGALTLVMAVWSFINYERKGEEQ